MDLARATHSARRALRAPRVVVLRHMKRDLTPAERKICEHFSYSPSVFAMQKAMQTKPDLLIDFDLDETSIVVDGGAYVGNWSERVAKRFGSRIHAFEPSPAVLPTLRERAARYPNFSVHEFALGDRNDTLTMTVQGPGSSFFPQNYFAQKEGVSTMTAPIRDVAEAFDELELDHIDLLALNIEGSEYEVLPRLAQTGWLPRIDALLLQFHEWLPRAHRRRRAIQQTLATSHTQMWDYPWIWEAWRRNDSARRDGPSRSLESLR